MCRLNCDSVIVKYLTTAAERKLLIIRKFYQTIPIITKKIKLQRQLIICNFECGRNVRRSQGSEVLKAFL